MSRERTQETLSALMDGEATELETRRLLRDLEDSDAEIWNRWQLTRDVMQGHGTAAVPAGFSQRLTQSLQQEAQQKQQVPGGSLSRMVVAASVAMATVFGWLYFSSTTADTATGVPQVATVAAKGNTDQSAKMRPFADAAMVSSRTIQPVRPPVSQFDHHESPHMKSMLVRHSEFAARHGGQNVTPYVRVVSMDARQGSR